MPEQQNTNGCTEESCAGCAHADSCSSKKEDFREPENKYSSIMEISTAMMQHILRLTEGYTDLLNELKEVKAELAELKGEKLKIGRAHV